MSSFTLKIIACVAMLIDHITALFVTDRTLMYIGRGIGRLAFPIFCFLVVEGFFHTKNVKKYLLRLGVFALISEIPFDYAFWYVTRMRNFFTSQNVFFTLFLGLLTITVYDTIAKKYKDQPWIFNVLAVLTIVAGGGIAILLKSDYSYMGILIIFVFYLFHWNKKRMMIAYFILAGFLFGGIQLLAVLDIPFLWFYNGEKGPSFKYGFYLFYPLHLLILGYLYRLIM